jgi:transposase
MKADGRSLDHATLTELRKRGVAAVQSGESPTLVAMALGVNLRSLFRWLALYRRGGWDRLDARKRGGRPPKLDGRALRWIHNTLTNKSPQQLQFPFALWTAAMVQTLIAQRYKVRLSHSSVCRLLHQLGLSAQRPLWRAYQQNPVAVKRWLETEISGQSGAGHGARARKSSLPMRPACARTSTAVRPGVGGGKRRWSWAPVRASAPI